MVFKTITLTPEDDVSDNIRILYKDKELIVTKAILTLDVQDKPHTENNKKLIYDMNINKCPCNDNCCVNPSTFNPHDCDDNCEEFCEESFTTECSNCGNSCGCDL